MCADVTISLSGTNTYMSYLAWQIPRLSVSQFPKAEMLPNLPGLGNSQVEDFGECWRVV